MPPLSTAVAALHSHLSVTAQRPVETDASRWLGEAEAIVADLARNQTLETRVVQERLTQVEALLAEVERTGDPVAEHHVELARELTGLILRRLTNTQ